MKPTLLIALALSLTLQTARELSTHALDTFLKARVDAGDVPFVVAMAVDGDSTRYAGAFGTDSNAIFRMASMTKPVTSLAVMMLYEQGKLGLDDPVTKYLPELSKLRVIGGRPPKRPIVIRDLLTHTSGVVYSFLDPRLAKLDDGHVVDTDLPLLYDPGEKFAYGPSTAILGDVVEKASGEPLDVFFRTRIFDPLGMRDTAYTVPAEKHGRVVTVWNRQADGSLLEKPNRGPFRSTPRGDGGLFSTAADYSRFMQLILNHGRLGRVRLLRDETVALMTSNQIGALTVEEQMPVETDLARPFPIGAGKDKFGFGFQIEAAPAVPGMRSVGSLSWGGIQNTHFWIDPRRSIAGVVLTQLLPYYDERALGVVRGFEKLVYERLTAPDR
jgi:methyl acetate hydrolase